MNKSISSKNNRVEDEEDDSTGNLLEGLIVAATEPSISETKAKSLVSKVECIKAARQHKQSKGVQEDHHKKKIDSQEEVSHHGTPAERRRRSHTKLVEDDNSPNPCVNMDDSNDCTFAVAASIAVAKESPLMSETKAKKLLARVECIKTARQHKNNSCLQQEEREESHELFDLEEVESDHGGAAPAEKRRRSSTMLLVETDVSASSTSSDDMDGSGLGVIITAKEPTISETKAKSLVSRVECIKTARQQKKNRKQTDKKAADEAESGENHPSPKKKKDKTNHSKTIRRTKSLSSEGSKSAHSHHKRSGRRSISGCNDEHKKAIAQIRQHKTHDGTMRSPSAKKRQSISADDSNAIKREEETQSQAEGEGDELETSGERAQERSSSLQVDDDGKDQSGNHHKPEEHSRKPRRRSSKMLEDDITGNMDDQGQEASDCSGLGYNTPEKSRKPRRQGHRSSMGSNGQRRHGMAHNSNQLGAEESAAEHSTRPRRRSFQVDCDGGEEPVERSKRMGRRTSGNDHGGIMHSPRVRRHNSHGGTMEYGRSKTSPLETRRRKSFIHPAKRGHGLQRLPSRRNTLDNGALRNGLQRTASRRNTLDNIGLRQLQRGLALQDKREKEEEEEQKHLEEMAEQMKKLNEQLEEEQRRHHEEEEQLKQAKAAAVAARAAAAENRESLVGGLAASWGFGGTTSANHPAEAGAAAATYNHMAQAMGLTALTGVLGFPTSVTHNPEPTTAAEEDKDDDKFWE